MIPFSFNPIIFLSIKILYKFFQKSVFNKQNRIKEYFSVIELKKNNFQLYLYLMRGIMWEEIVWKLTRAIEKRLLDGHWCYRSYTLEVKWLTQKREASKRRKLQWWWLVFSPLFFRVSTRRLFFSYELLLVVEMHPSEDLVPNHCDTKFFPVMC